MKKISAIIAAGLLVIGLASCGEKYDLVTVKGGSFTEADFDTWDELKRKTPETLEKEEARRVKENERRTKVAERKGEEPELLPEPEYTGTFTLSVSDFMISKYEVTQKLYEEIMSSDPDVNPKPAYFNNADPKIADKEKAELRPVERITWYDCLYFCNKLSEKEGLEPVYTLEGIQRYEKDKAIKTAKVTADYTKNGYRLPTYAEWVWAACGGVKGKGVRKYAGTGDLPEISWFVNNSKEMTHQVGLKKANELGLYDMTGNVCEWCYDYLWEAMNPTDYADYTGPATGRYRFIPGGCFTDVSGGASFPYDITTDQLGGIQGLRYWNIGFRLARSVPKKNK